MGTGDVRPGLWRKRVWPILLAIPVALGALLVSGLFLPIPVLDVIAAGLSGLFAWLLPVSLLLAGLAFLLMRARRTRFRAVLMGVSGTTLALWLLVAAQSFWLAASEEVQLNAGELFFGLSVENRAPDETLEYTRYDDRPVTLSIWRPAGTAGPAPVLVMTHGGGFAGGSVQEQLLPYARWFANQGYLVIGANYTLSSESVHAWDVAEGQIACALAWAGAHASEYGGDVSRLGMYGESAGGNLVINVSYKAASGVLVSPCGGDVPKVSAVAGLYPVVGIIEAYENRHILGNTGRKFDEMYLGGTPDQYPERYAAVQSVNAISPVAPPTLVVYGAADHLVTPNGTRNFIKAAEKAGLTIRPVKVPYGEHGFDIVSGGVGGQVWRQTSLQWFEEHLPST